MDKQQEFKYILAFVCESDFTADEICCDMLRSLWTAYCLHHNLICDTKEYDESIMKIWSMIAEKGTTHPWASFKRFDLAMGKFLS